MAFYQFRHPWDPGYATPDYALAEPPGRGTFTTKWLPRGTIPGKKGTQASGAPIGNGYAQPAYVLAEPPLRGVFVTKQLPRRTIGAKAPDYLARPVRKPLRRQHSLSGTSLGDVEHFGGGASQSPFLGYGAVGTKAILAMAKNVSPKDRSRYLNSVLNRLNPDLPLKVARSVEQYQSKGFLPEAALERALQVNLSAGIAEEVVAIGKGKRRSLMGLGAVRPTTAQRLAATSVVQKVRVGDKIKKSISLGGGTPIPIKFKVIDLKSIGVGTEPIVTSRMEGSKNFGATGLDALLPKLPPAVAAKLKEIRGYSSGQQAQHLVRPMFKAGGGNAAYVRVYEGQKRVWNFSNPSRITVVQVYMDAEPGGNFISSAVGSLVGVVQTVLIKGVKFVIKILEVVKEAVEAVANKLADLACKTMNNDLAVAASAGAGAAYAGSAEVGVAGATVARGLCAGGEPGYYEGGAQPSSILPWLVVGGGALLLVFGATQ